MDVDVDVLSGQEKVFHFRLLALSPTVVVHLCQRHERGVSVVVEAVDIRAISE